MEIYIVNHQIFIIIIIRKLYTNGLSYSQTTKANNFITRFERQRIYIPNQNSRGQKNVNLLMGGNQFIVNSQQYYYEKKKYYLTKYFHQLKRFQILVMNIQLCYFIENLMNSFMNFNISMLEKSLDKNILRQLFRITEQQIIQRFYNIIRIYKESLILFSYIQRLFFFSLQSKQISRDGYL
ncbi:unnamed protein product [Paramecium sonneborni]|uniref:Uncharacterized protein n=1 Tax=Paramecium sonneborni TaxID=65129 RepID=A0A8S1KS14_9CILI|nr:unnamed protein product [Paramecium sonneborni]